MVGCSSRGISHVLANHFFACIFSNFNFRCRYYIFVSIFLYFNLRSLYCIFLQYSSGPEED